MSRRIVLLLILALFTVGLLHAANRPSPSEATKLLVQRVPRLTEETADHLLHDNPDELRAYLARFDPETIMRTGRCLCEAVDTTSIDLFIESRNFLYGLGAPVFAFMEEEFDFVGENRAFSQRAGLPPEEGLALTKAWKRGRHCIVDATIPIEQRVAGLRRLIAVHDEHRLDWNLPHCKYRLSILLRDRGRSDESLVMMKEAIAEAKARDSIIMACQAMGTLGFWMGQDGDFESMARLYEDFKQLALRYNVGDQASRACLFMGAHYQDQGRLNLALASFQEAERIAYETKSYVAGFRALFYLGRFYTDLGCWDLARQANDAARDRRADLWRSIDSILGLTKARVAETEMMCLMQEGKVDAASRGFRRILGELPSCYGASDSLRFYTDWSQGLMEQDLAIRAIEILDEARPLLTESADTDDRLQYQLLRARALFASGRMVECEHMLNCLEKEVPEEISNRVRMWSRHDALRIRLARVADDPDAVAHWLEVGLRRLGENLSTLDASQESYLLHQSRNPLRDVTAEILSDYPERDLLAHLLWREVPRLMGFDNRGEVDDHASSLAVLSDLLRATVLQQPLPSSVEALLRAYHEALAENGGQHLVYAIRDEKVVRWRGRADGLQRDELSLGSKELSLRIKRSVEAISRKPGSKTEALGRTARRDLHDLARNLLPADLMSGKEPDCLYLTVDGCLATLPFSALNLSARAYRPLLLSRPVVYLRALRGAPPSDMPGPGVVVTAPLAHRRLQRLLDGLETLDHARVEAEYLATWDSSAELLVGRTATKPALQKSWQDADYLYFAGHVARDPQVPYRSFVPLTADEDQALLDHSLLGVKDIRACRFDRTSLVVLSGCASGATYVTQAANAPSLGDVFLDAGVQTSVQTFWSVSDAAGLALMSRFIREWRAQGQPPDLALWQARRDLYADEDGPWQHPFYWASYAVKHAGFPNSASD